MLEVIFALALESLVMDADVVTGLTKRIPGSLNL